MSKYFTRQAPEQSSGGGGKAADVLARVSREYYQDWLSQGPALQESLMNLTTYNNPGIANEEIGAGVLRTNRALNAATTNYQNRLDGYGIAPTAEQQAVNSRLTTINRSSQVVNAANQIRQALYDRNRAIATGGLTTSKYDEIVEG